MKIVGVPKTIDNDVSGTITTFGFDTAVNTALEAIDKLHTTAESARSRDRAGGDGPRRRVHRAALGRRGHGGRHPHSRNPVRHQRRSARRSCRATARGGTSRSSSSRRARFPRAATCSLIGDSLPGESRRLGGLCEPIAREIQRITGKETRSLVLGHLQRGGMPTGYDRLLATRFGGAAVRAVADEKWGHMVALQSPHIVTMPIEEALREPKRVDPTHDVVLTARATGISFGD